MDVVATDVERYSDPTAFAKEVNLPLLGTAALPPVRPGASLSELIAASNAEGLEPIVENLAQTRQSLTLRSLLLAGFPHDPECFALGLALGRAWSRRGLKVLIVDLDPWNPTILRGVGEPAEGMVDVLEYGCSFQRVAWEVVAGSLWVVGAGMHPIDELRLADHAEWERAARVFAARADVTLYVAPLLHKPGLTGRLSKRMDGVLLTASVDRVSRVELRDAFLELWGSDAPIIGCVGIDPRATPPDAARRAASAPRQSASRIPDAQSSSMEPGEPGRPASHSAGAAPEAHVASVATAAETPSYDAALADAGESALVAALEREVRLGALSDHARSNRRRSGGWLWGGIAAVTVVLAAAAAWVAFLGPHAGEKGAVATETRPVGDESVLPPPAAPPEPVAQSGAASASASGSAAGTSAPPSAPPGAATSAPIAARLGGSTGPIAPSPTSPTAPTTPPTARVASGAPLTTAPPADGKKFRVHVASFRSEEKVAPIVRALRLKGLDAWYEPASDAPGWYRVFVGRFATEDEASAYASWLLQHKWVDRAHAFPSTSR